jgi:hypothetical protein
MKKIALAFIFLSTQPAFGGGVISLVLHGEEEEDEQTALHYPRSGSDNDEFHYPQTEDGEPPVRSSLEGVMLTQNTRRRIQATQAGVTGSSVCIQDANPYEQASLPKHHEPPDYSPAPPNPFALITYPHYPWYVILAFEKLDVTIPKPARSRRYTREFLLALNRPECQIPSAGIKAAVALVSTEIEKSQEMKRRMQQADQRRRSLCTTRRGGEPASPVYGTHNKTSNREEKGAQKGSRGKQARRRSDKK